MTKEFEVFAEFVRLADQIGIHVPGAEYIIERRIIPEHIWPGLWPREELIGGLALAQHHGVPTRLIDFTRSPLVAAFFSARNWLCRPQEERPDEIAIWALNLNFLQNAIPTFISIVEVPASPNPFLRAQRAFFMRITAHPPEQDTNHNDVIAVIQCAARRASVWEEYSKQMDVFACIPPVIRRFILPGKQVEALCARLLDEDITLAHLMPTLDNVTATMKLERTLWRGPLPISAVEHLQGDLLALGRGGE